MRPSNPFKPTAGAQPPHLIGRDNVLLDFDEGLEGGVGAPGRLMRITGPRGSGKTVLLSDLGDRARSQGWDVVDVTAGPDFMSDLVYELSPNKRVQTIEAGAGIAGMKGTVTAQVKQPNLRELMRKSASASTGLLITIDEVQDADREDMARVAQAVQHMIREKQDIALVFAGLTTGVMDLINGKAMTFLRRALDESLTAIDVTEVEVSLRDSFEQTGLSLSPAALATMSQATAGYPYLIQLVGYYVWQRADRHREASPEVRDADVRDGVAIASARFHEAVHVPAIAHLTDNALDYLYAMTEDEDISSTAAIARRLGKKPATLSYVRRSLLEHEVIETPRRGYVRFAIPFLREYLIENEAELRGER